MYFKINSLNIKSDEKACKEPFLVFFISKSVVSFALVMTQNLKGFDCTSRLYKVSTLAKVKGRYDWPWHFSATAISCLCLGITLYELCKNPWAWPESMCEKCARCDRDLFTVWIRWQEPGFSKYFKEGSIIFICHNNNNTKCVRVTIPFL